MIKDYWDILKDFPPSSENNARAIIRNKLESMSKAPSESKAQDLERYGITCDYSNADAGEPPVEWSRL